MYTSLSIHSFRKLFGNFCVLLFYSIPLSSLLVFLWILKAAAVVDDDVRQKSFPPFSLSLSLSFFFKLTFKAYFNPSEVRNDYHTRKVEKLFLWKVLLAKPWELTHPYCVHISKLKRDEVRFHPFSQFWKWETLIYPLVFLYNVYMHLYVYVSIQKACTQNTHANRDVQKTNIFDPSISP